MIFRERQLPVIPDHALLVRPADSLDASTCLGGAAATGKLPRDISTSIR
jgi:hypothetical protein